MSNLGLENLDDLVPIKDVPKLIPGRPHISTIWRWMGRGAGGEKLNWVKIGGRRYTSLEEIKRFCHSLTAEQKNQGSREAPSRTRQRQIDQAAQTLQRLLGGND